MTVSELIEQFNTLDVKPGRFLQNLLEALSFLGQADSGVILRVAQGKKVDILALYPQIKSDIPVPQWLTLAMKFVLEPNQSDAMIIKPFKSEDISHNQSEKSHIVMIPIMIPDIGKTIAAFLLNEDNEEALESKVQRLRLSTGILNFSQSSFVQQNWQQNCRPKWSLS